VTQLDRIVKRLSLLIGMEVTAQYSMGHGWFEFCTGSGDRYVYWAMLPEDLLYSDDELVSKFVKPIRDHFEKRREN